KGLPQNMIVKSALELAERGHQRFSHETPAEIVVVTESGDGHLALPILYGIGFVEPRGKSLLWGTKEQLKRSEAILASKLCARGISSSSRPTLSLPVAPNERGTRHSRTKSPLTAT